MNRRRTSRFTASSDTDANALERGRLVRRWLGSPGDRIEFGEQEVRVNGRAQPRAPQMPLSGGLTVEPKTWFTWPVLNERIIRIDQAHVDHAYLSLASVPE